MIAKLGYPALVLALLVAGGLYALKLEVQHRERELRQLHAAIADEHVALTRLRTDFAMLSRPSRTSRLAVTHLDLVPAQPRQIMTISDVPQRSELMLSQRLLRALLPSGVRVPLRLKPSGMQRLIANDTAPWGSGRHGGP